MKSNRYVITGLFTGPIDDDVCVYGLNLLGSLGKSEARRMFFKSK